MNCSLCPRSVSRFSRTNVFIINFLSLFRNFQRFLHAPEVDYLTSICFGFASSALGCVTVRVPYRDVELTLLAFPPGGGVILRRNFSSLSYDRFGFAPLEVWVFWP